MEIKFLGLTDYVYGAEDEYLRCFYKLDKVDQALVLDNPENVNEAYYNTRLLADVKSLLLISLDLELKEDTGALTEVGIAWIDLAKIGHIAPEQSGRNWHPYIEARQLRIAEYQTYRMQNYVLPPECGFLHGKGT